MLGWELKSHKPHSQKKNKKKLLPVPVNPQCTDSDQCLPKPSSNSSPQAVKTPFPDAPLWRRLWASQESALLGYPGGSVMKNPPANAGDTSLIPGPGRSHMPRHN